MAERRADIANVFRLSRVSAAFWLMLALALGFLAPPARTQNLPPLLGDLTGDRLITFHDALAVAKLVVSSRRPSADQLAVGDVAPVPGIDGREYGDGRLTLEDAAEILRRAVGLGKNPWPGGRVLPLIPYTSTVFLGSSSRLDVVLSTGFQVSGKVVDENNRPFQGSIRLVSSASASAGECVLGLDGSFFLAVPRGTYSVEVVTKLASDAFEGEIVQRQIQFVQVNGDSTLVVKRPPLPRLPAVSGTVTSQDGKFSATNVIFRDIDFPLDANRRRTEIIARVTNGQYTLRVPIGQHKVFLKGRVFLDDGRTADVVLAHPELVYVGADRPLPIRVPPIRMVGGVVTNASRKPLQTGFVEARIPFAWGKGASSASQVDRNGRYLLGLIEGQYTFLVSSEDKPPAADGVITFVKQGVSVSANRQLDIVIPPPPKAVQIRGSVVDERGRPMRGARVFAESMELSQVLRDFYYFNSVLTEADGSFSLSLPEGRYTVVVQPPEDLYPPAVLSGLLQ
ncbi:MAG: carboxypeptidase regulatory-like domain-containing protein [Armatimonadota bacterium]